MFKIENIQIILLLKIFFVLLKLNLLDQNNYLFHSKINNKQFFYNNEIQNKLFLTLITYILSAITTSTVEKRTCSNNKYTFVITANSDTNITAG